MWIFTQTGFISAVRHNARPGYLMVRARDARSLAGLCSSAGTDITRTPIADYPYRTVVSDEDLKVWLDGQLDDLDYVNFKSRCAATLGKRFAHALGEVWSVMHDVEDSDSRRNSG